MFAYYINKFKFIIIMTFSDNFTKLQIHFLFREQEQEAITFTQTITGNRLGQDRKETL